METIYETIFPRIFEIKILISVCITNINNVVMLQFRNVYVMCQNPLYARCILQHVRLCLSMHLVAYLCLRMQYVEEQKHQLKN